MWCLVLNELHGKMSLLKTSLSGQTTRGWSSIPIYPMDTSFQKPFQNWHRKISGLTRNAAVLVQMALTRMSRLPPPLVLRTSAVLCLSLASALSLWCPSLRQQGQTPAGRRVTSRKVLEDAGLSLQVSTSIPLGVRKKGVLFLLGSELSVNALTFLS